MAIKDIVAHELQIRQLLGLMIEYLTAMKQKSYLSVDDRIKGLDDVRLSIPAIIRHLNYIKTMEINNERSKDFPRA